MTSLAARDLENLIDTHQTITASKPLNQNVRGLQPKTPGNKAFQTPFKSKIHDENAAFTFKAGAKNIKENIALRTVGKGKNVLATPGLGLQVPRTALGAKTTNRMLQTPGIALKHKESIRVTPRNGDRPPSIRKAKPQTEETAKLQIPVDDDFGDVPSSPEIEYIPPRPVPLPDVDDYLPSLDLSVFDGFDGKHTGIIFAHSYYHQPINDEGLSRAQIAKKEREETDKILELREDARILRDSELALLTCVCEDECPAGDCKEWPEKLRNAEEKYQKVMSELLLPHEQKEREESERQKARKASVDARVTRATSRAGPSEVDSKRAASALSIRSDSGEKTIKPTKARNYPKPWLAGSKPSSKTDPRSKSPPSGYSSRHAAGAAASRTNLGFSRGRSASSQVRGSVLDGKFPSSAALAARPRKTESQLLQEMWRDVDRLRGEDSDDGLPSGSSFKSLIDEEAEKDFELKLEL